MKLFNFQKFMYEWTNVRDKLYSTLRGHRSEECSLDAVDRKERREETEERRKDGRDKGRIHKNR